jgi:dTDP-4-dehydrorhamnose reductase
MRVLILGATGMLGHKMHDMLSREHDVTSTTRSALATLPTESTPFFGRGRVVERFQATDLTALDALLVDVQPAAVINCIGVIKQRDAAHDAITSITINALFPHQLVEVCAARGIRVIHFSTDCVFSGERGDYTEDDTSDALDLYGRTKYLGEVSDPGSLTIRSSIIGRELANFRSLLEWFLRQTGEVRGFRRAIYTGLTTVEMARSVDRVLVDHPGLEGLYQVASEKISKYDLLEMIRQRFGLQTLVKLLPDDTFACDRSLRGDRFVAATGIKVQAWQDMIDELAVDAARYGSVSK